MVRSTWPEPATGRGRAGLGEVGRFAVTGGLAYLVDVFVFNLALLLVGTDYLSAKVVSSSAAITVAYLGSRFYTWPARRPSGAHPVVAFVAVSALAAAVQVGCLWVSHDIVGWTSPVADNVSANVVGMALATVARFFGFRRLVFGGLTAQGDGVQDGALLVDGTHDQLVVIGDQLEEVTSRGALRGERLAAGRAQVGGSAGNHVDHPLLRG